MLDCRPLLLDVSVESLGIGFIERVVIYGEEI